MSFSTKLDKFVDDEKSGGLLLIACTLVSLVIANTAFQNQYIYFWSTYIGGLSIEHWVNDGLMAIFFLTIGLELKREMLIGEFSNPRNAILPVAAAIGGMLFPAGLYFLFNKGLPTQSGLGIPMATDIAFALGILSLLGKRVPFSIKIFLMALAVVDDLGAIVVIALFYTKGLVLFYLGLAFAVLAGLLVMRRFKIYAVTPYLIGGAIMWYFMLKSGVHATITGVLVAFAIPFIKEDGQRCPSFYLMHRLHIPVSFVILPLFALANTAVTLSSNFTEVLSQPVSLGILSGLVLGKPLGIFLVSFLVVSLGLCKLPQGISWSNIIGVGFLGGIGFTMSIFITLLAFDDIQVINTAKIIILCSSLLAGIIGYSYLYVTLKKTGNE